jgi:hypothetical protein
MKLAIFTLLSTISFASAASAGPKCTTEKANWKDKDAFQKTLKDEGYKIKVFKVTKGDCYEIYGWNKEGKKVEIYFNPITGEKVKEEIN